VAAAAALPVNARVSRDEASGRWHRWSARLITVGIGGRTQVEPADASDGCYFTDLAIPFDAT
jgi:hypothetical protein